MCYTTDMKHGACKNFYYRLALYACIALWVSMIWRFSAQPAMQSEQTSGGISMRLAALIFGTPTEAQYDLMERLVRKGAHMAEFALLAMLCCSALEAEASRRPVPLALGLTALAAAADELHQLFVPGRAGLMGDVCIDVSGGILGLLLFLLLRRGERGTLLP